MPYKDKEKQRMYVREYAKKNRERLKNIPVSGLLKRGDKVKIFNLTSYGKEFLEGTATLEQKMFPEKYAEYWRVRFDDGTDVMRWVRAANKCSVPKQKEAEKE
jgi:hypothetical protein